ncbi:hypothetical protein Hanom_Chr09g00786091 [Helianthus anomalus]
MSGHRPKLHMSPDSQIHCSKIFTFGTVTYLEDRPTYESNYNSSIQSFRLPYSY